MTRRRAATLIALAVAAAALLLAAPAEGAVEARQLRERPAASWWLINPCDPDAPPVVRLEPPGHGAAWAWCQEGGGPGVVVAQGDWQAVYLDGRLLYGRVWLPEVWR